MNFWEARQAAKAGKTVQMITTDPLPLKPKEFLCDSYWRNEHLDAEWEVVLETYTTRFETYLTKGIISKIEFTYDENGKLISAKNI